MTDFLRDNWKFLLPALVLHVAIGALLTANFHAKSRQAAPSQLAIQARVIDQSAIRRVNERERQAEAQRLAKQRAEEQAAQEEREREAAEQREREAEVQRQKQAAELKVQQQAAEAKQREAAARQQREQANKQRAAEVQRKQREQATKQRAEQDARAQAQREAELKRQLAEEEGRMQAANSGLLNQYVALIEQRVIRNWNKPLSARAGIECEVKVTQAPGGTVLSVQVGKCNGDTAVRQSIEAAVHRASPLPPPPDPRLFERVLLIVFKPND
jgi:colicin import membrane protein